MIVLVTTVGISVFENSIEDMDDTYELLRRTSTPFSTEWHNFIEEISEDCIRAIKDSNSNGFNNPDFNYSAEITSIRRIAEQTENNVHVHLIASDTILSVAAAIIVKDWFEQDNVQKKYSSKISISFEVPDKLEVQSDSLHIIKNLNIQEQEEYREGFINLFEVLATIKDKIRKECLPFKEKDEMELNITGGYKAIAPILTLYGQLERIPVKYIYNENELNKLPPVITISTLPINFDWEIVEALTDTLEPGFISHIKNQNEELYKELIKYNLISNEGHITIIAQLFKRYVEHKSSISRSILGAYLELVLFHYFTLTDNEESYFAPSKEDDKLIYNPILNHVIECKGKTKEKIKKEKKEGKYFDVGDIDLAIKRKDDPSKKIICEIKAVSSTAKKLEEIGTKKDYYDRQIKPRIIHYQPSEFHYYAYTISYMKRDNSNDSFSTDVEKNRKFIEIMDYYKKRIKNDPDTKKVTFRVRLFHVDLSKQSLNINYSKLLQEPFEKSQWIEIPVGELS
ncbi:MAG: hypothetical protein MI974_29070 [Chitinophagales bacterium]|nr:hypothetical protein [Chitinophagales bacterium]